MCGFIGVYQSKRNSISDQSILDALAAINHRGPDEHSLWRDPGERAVPGRTAERGGGKEG